MFDFEDKWWLVAIVLLTALWIMGVVIPIRMAAPTLSIAERFADLEVDTGDEVLTPPRPASILLPLLNFIVALGLTAGALRKRIVEPEGGTRWVWMCAAAGLSAFWSIILLLMTMRMAQTLAGG